MKIMVGVVSVLMSVVVTIIVAVLSSNSPAGFIWSGSWWLLNISIAITTFGVSNFIINKIFVTKEHSLPTPTAATAFDEAIKAAKYNFFAISSKSMSLWRTDTFVHYLLLNDIKNILEYSYKNRGLPISFSDEPKDRQDFLDEGRYLISRIAAGKGTPFFWGIRLLIYPKKTLHEYKEQVLSLISLHSLARVHCIPIVREELLKVLPEDKKKQISAFAERLGQKRIDSEMTLYSPVLRLSTYMKQFRDPNHPFRYKIPDVLAVNILNLSGNNPEIWWFDGIYSEHNKEDLANEAEKIIRILCKTIVEHYTPVVWSEYSMQNIPVVPVAKKISEIEIDFFSLPYFSKWLRTILSSSDESSFSRLKKWFSKEAEILRKITKKEKIIKALDVGCGWGRHMELLLRSGVQYVAGVDASPAMVMKANNLYRIYPGKVSIRLERAEDMSFESSFFDLVICMTNTFGNFSKRKEKVLKEMVRTLRPGGILVLSVYKHSDEALDLRIQSYKAIGLHPACIDGKTVYTTEGLVAEQFTEQEINSMLSNHGIITEHVEYVRNLALIFVGRKTES